MAGTRRVQASKRRTPLSRERVVRAALELVDREGLEALSMRRLGAELGVEAMSLYNHVRDKDDLLGAVTELALSRFRVPEPSGDWAEDARRAAREWRRLFLEHPSLIRLLAERNEPLRSPAALGPMEHALDILARAGLTPREAVQAFHAFGGYIFGFVMMEQGIMLTGDDPVRRRAHVEMAEAVEAAHLPRLREAMPDLMECDGDEQFVFGLELLIEGLRAKAAARA
ncbi:MAG TPA: TetR/AcrR family transcriptional regulator C-terminal domain-containing protein [Actinomycetota bacterium]|nr:TetR/AcrR family transcriptional regulator C-terminal domain-containing protein [Actinomycetota bacterium]